MCVCSTGSECVCVGAQPGQADEYLCTSLKLSDLAPNKKLWIIKFAALTTGNRKEFIKLSLGFGDYRFREVGCSGF